MGQTYLYPVLVAKLIPYSQWLARVVPRLDLTRQPGPAHHQPGRIKCVRKGLSPRTEPGVTGADE